MIDFSFSLIDFEYILLITVRIASFMFVAPFFSQRGVPAQAKIGFSFLVAVILFSVVPAPEQVYTGVLGYGVAVLKEGITGLLIGFAAYICNSIVIYAGNIIDMDIGVSMAQQYNPEMSMQMTATGNLYYYMIFGMFIATSNHLANNEQTKGMMRYEHFASMPPYATFINTARGPQLVQTDLFRVLEERPDLTALIDVTAPEPIPMDSPYYTLRNCFISPHLAGSESNEHARMGEYMLEEFRCCLEGRPTRYEVTADMLKTMA